MIADGRLLDLIRRVYCFGMSLLKLDLRQESTRHADTMDAITTYLGYGRWGWSWLPVVAALVMLEAIVFMQSLTASPTAWHHFVSDMDICWYWRGLVVKSSMV